MALYEAVQKQLRSYVTPFQLRQRERLLLSLRREGELLARYSIDSFVLRLVEDKVLTEEDRVFYAHACAVKHRVESKPRANAEEKQYRLLSRLFSISIDEAEERSYKIQRALETYGFLTE